MLFEDLPRSHKRIVRMHVIDAGGDFDVHMKCSRCGHDAGWLSLKALGITITEAKRGLPCPACNPPAK